MYIWGEQETGSEFGDEDEGGERSEKGDTEVGEDEVPFKGGRDEKQGPRSARGVFFFLCI